MKLLLISKTTIVIRILTLVCEKLNLCLEYQDNNAIKDTYDVVIIDEEFIDYKFNIIKQYTKKVGVISKEEFLFEKEIDFVIPRPFLPSKLESILQRYVMTIKKERVSPHKNEDESIILVDSLSHGGILNNKELIKIKEMLDTTTHKEKTSKDTEDENLDDLSHILDEVINDAKEYDFTIEKNKPAKVILNDTSMREFQPLLNQLDKDIVDNLIHGDTIDIQLQLKK